MALLQDLIQQIDDPVLRERIMQETDKLVKQKKFGLVLKNICRNAHLFTMCLSVLGARLH